MAEATLPTDVSLETATYPVAGTCPNCQARMARAYCAECGQRASRGRLTLRSIVAHLLTDALDLDRGLLFTFLELIRRPGAVAREYVKGRTVTYANPVKYFLVMGALTTLVYVNTGLAGEMATGLAEGMKEGSRGEIHPQASAVLEVISSYFTLLMAATIPSTALASRLVFRRAGYNYAEHLVFSTFVGAQQCALAVALLLAGASLGGDSQALLQWSVVPMGAYYAWAATEFVGASRVRGFLLGAVSYALSYVLFAVCASVVGLFAGIAIAVARGG